MSSLYVDTHAAVYLHAGELALVGTEGKRQIDACQVLISPMVLLEFDYLYASGKIRYRATEIYTALNATFGVTLCSFPFSDVAHQALSIQWTLDPFDRLIVAQAQANHNSALVTRDRTIRLNYPQAIW